MKFPLCDYHSAMRSYWRMDWAEGYPATVDKEQCTECIYRKSPEYQKLIEDLTDLFFGRGDNKE